MTRDEILNRAERHSKMAAGWIFNASGLEKYWKEAYEKGRKDQREECARFVENADFTNPNLLAQMIREM
jgi:hypothetical protein